jgi:hypothetical protein
MGKCEKIVYRFLKRIQKIFLFFKTGRVQVQIDTLESI